MIQRISIAAIFIVIFSQNTCSQFPDSTSFKINPRYSFYSYERIGEAILHVPLNLAYNNLSVRLRINEDSVIWKGVPGKKILRIPVRLDYQPGNFEIKADIKISGRSTKYVATGNLSILNYKPNEVKTDRLTGGLIVSKREFFPFGFYCYSPVNRTLPEEEVVKGFNMMSPYQKILPQTLNERKSYMDRCAELGMKVHYNLLSVTGGGGVGSKDEHINENEKTELLLNEINTFKDHPALLAWYIADEPTGNKISPDSLFQIYNIVRKADPWHPVSIVFMAPFISSKKYADGLDIVMADPYPVPDSPVTMVGDVAALLYGEFRGKKPVWIVPQAFGGGEWWGREPTIQEIRAMTYQSIINGARGIQFFIRQGLNLFPKSTSAWAECGQMAIEIAELTPWLLSDEETISVSSGNRNIIVTSAVHNDRLMIMAANRTNLPQRADYSILKPVSGKVKVIFENRDILSGNGLFSDQLSAFGTQVYLVDLKSQKDSLKPWTDNLLKDPGFEDISSPGIPASCYARNGGDRGATYFLDSREHVEGFHSIRLVTPKENAGIKLRFFPVQVMNGRTYHISVMAKADPGEASTIPEEKHHFFEIMLGEYGSERFELTGEWKKYTADITIPYITDQPPGTNIILLMPSAGVAWFDMLQVAAGIDINQCINPELKEYGF